MVLVNAYSHADITSAQRKTVVWKKFVCTCVDIMSVGNVSATLSGVTVLSGTNFKTWKNKVTLLLGCMDLDHALREPCPATLTDQSSLEDRRVFERWERSNRIGLIIIKNTIPETFLDTMSEENDVRHFLDTLEERFIRSDKAEMSAVLRKLVSMRYKGDGNILEYVLDMFHLAGKLKGLKIELPEDVLVHLVLIALSSSIQLV
ncbi:uncharacterized protein LOC120274626 [Dioscorea cayenensis subsp. rotundata]|uniref:Uncharacterized protein LOC120274626 n=1 Tax=Dioscorea cayennensis subsp. rotundata TaxID=55577 RepID=A0AB40CFK9_DIOCR|nr:uncharacterized protein LOC120274626 [Dioscorea cayenensis subsp. rotundata]